MKKNTTTIAKLTAKLSNNKMVKVVAGLVGKEEFDLSEDGKIELSDEDEDHIRKVYGEGFLSKLKAADFSGEAAKTATDLFDEAVNAMVEAKTAELNETLTQLRSDIEKLAADPEDAPAAKGAKTPQAGETFHIDMKARHNRAVAAALASGNPFGANLSSDSVDVSELNAELSIAMPPKFRLELLLKRIYQGFTDHQYFTPIQSNTDYIAAAAIFTEVSQQFTPEWTPKGKSKFTPIRIQYRRHKINVAVKPTELLGSWLMFLYTQGKSQADMPFVKYVIEEHILPKVLEDITLSMIGKGKYVAVDLSTLNAGDAGSAAKNSMDGIETILVEGKAGTNVEAAKVNFLKNAQDIRTMTDKQCHDYIDAFVDKVIGQFVDKNVPVYCAPEVLTKYQRAEFAITGIYTGRENDGSIRFTKAHLRPMACMYNSPILFTTPKENMGLLMDLSKPENCINDIQKADYDVKIFGEYSLSVGFKIAEAVFASVPDGYTPSNVVRANAEVDTTVWENGTVTTSSTSDEDEDNGEASA